MEAYFARAQKLVFLLQQDVAKLETTKDSSLHSKSPLPPSPCSLPLFDNLFIDIKRR